MDHHSFPTLLQMVDAVYCLREALNDTVRSAQQQRIAAETPEEIEARLQQLSTAQQQDCCRIDRGERGPS